MSVTDEHRNEAGASEERSFPDDAVRQELRRLLTDSDFEANDRRREMLAYVVEETLSGRGDRLKGAVLAQEVFGRGAEFDPQSDPVVRIEARRLRRDLDSYYAGHGDRAAVRFSIPKGAYAATFDAIGGATGTQDAGAVVAVGATEPDCSVSEGTALDRMRGRFGRGRSSWIVFLAAIFLLVVAVVVRPWPQSTEVVVQGGPPRLAIAPFEALRSSEEDGFLARGLSEQLIHDLMLFRGFRVYSLPEDRTVLSEANLASLRSDHGIEYLVTGTLGTAPVEGTARLLVQLRAVDGRMIWSGEFDRQWSASDLVLLQDELSTTIAATLGQTYGVIATDKGAEMASRDIPSDDTFACLMQAHAYRRSFTPQMRGQTHQCLEAAVRTDPLSADAWAMAGWVRLDLSRFEGIEVAERKAYSDAALQATEEAVRLAPRSVLALQAHAAVLHNRGSFDEAERFARAALEINPDDPETLHQLGWRLAVRGRFEEGVGYIRQAMERSIDPPRRYYNFLAIDDYLRGDYGAMLASARTSAASGSSIGNALLAIANTKAPGGTPEGAAQALRQMAELRPELASDPGAVFRRHGATDEIANTLVEGMKEAGWEPPAF